MERAISADDTPIAYRRAGSGPPLLLVHGTAADHTRWTPLLPALEGRYTVHALDRRGRGASGDAAAYAIDREVDDLIAVVEAIGAPVAVLGHSFGAICALEAACRTGAIDRLILYEPPYIVSPTLRLASAEVSARLEELVARGDGDAALEYFFLEVPRLPPDQVVALRAAPTWPARVAAAHTLNREIQAAESYPFAPETAASRHRPCSCSAATVRPSSGRRPRPWRRCCRMVASPRCPASSTRR
jgi:pimeloyl-ACP methyl ester carboxylesterase